MVKLKGSSVRLATHRKYRPEVNGQMRIYINTKAKLAYQVLTACKVPDHDLPLFALLFGSAYKPGLILVSLADAAPAFLIPQRSE
jgi:hypothetical protein